MTENTGKGTAWRFSYAQTLEWLFEVITGESGDYLPLQHPYGDLKHGTETRDHVNPERGLCAAILKQAILDLFLQSPDISKQVKRGKISLCEQKKIVRDAYEWLFLRHTNKEPFSFPWICDQIDLDCDALRGSLFKLLHPSLASAAHRKVKQSHPYLFKLPLDTVTTPEFGDAQPAPSAHDLNTQSDAQPLPKLKT